MFGSSYFAKSYFAGTYWPPNGSTSIVDSPDFAFRPIMRPRRR